MLEEQMSCIFSVKGPANESHPCEKNPAEVEDESTACRISLNVRSSTTQLLSRIKEEIFKCNLCDGTFSQLAALNLHLSNHTADKPFHTHTEEKLSVSTVCEKKFYELGDLKTHLHTHTREKPLACTECGNRFSRRDNLKAHLRTHTGEKPFACTVCEKRFSQESHLKIHLRNLTGEKPFACTVCEKRFSRQDTLKTHLRTHTGEKPFACTECGKRFSERGSLKKHLRTHRSLTKNPNFVPSQFLYVYSYNFPILIH